MKFIPTPRCLRQSRSQSQMMDRKWISRNNERFSMTLRRLSAKYFDYLSSLACVWGNDVIETDWIRVSSRRVCALTSQLRKLFGEFTTKSFLDFAISRVFLETEEKANTNWAWLTGTPDSWSTFDCCLAMLIKRIGIIRVSIAAWESKTWKVSLFSSSHSRATKFQIEFTAATSRLSSRK